MKPTIQAGRKKRKAGLQGGRKRHGGGALPAIGRSPPRQAQQGRLSLPGHTRQTPRKSGRARHVKTSPELSTHLPELEHRMTDAVQSSSDAIAALRQSMGIAPPVASSRSGGRPPRHRSVGKQGPNSARSPHRHGAGLSEAGGSGEDLREAYEVLLERTEVLADELEELREQERRQKVSGSAEVASPEDAEGGELERLRALIAGLERGVQQSSAQLESLRGRFDEEVQAKATEVEAAVRRDEQKRVAELERALKASSSTNATMESALADMKKQEQKQEKKRIQSDYGQTEVIDELNDATVPSEVTSDVTSVEVDNLRLAWTKAFERRSAVALAKLFAPNGRLQGSLSTVAKRDAPRAAPFAGASAITDYFNGFFQRFPLVKVQGAGMLQPADPEGIQAIAEGTAVWSTAAELHLYDHPQDVTFKTANVSFVFTLRRLGSARDDALQILSQHCVVTALVRGGPNDDAKLSARSNGSGKQSARGAGADAQPMSAQQLLEQRAQRQAAQKQRREEMAAKRQQRAIEEEEARRAQEDTGRKAAVAAQKRALRKRQTKAAGHAATSAPKEGTDAAKRSKKMEHLATVEVNISGTNSLPRPSPERNSPRKTPKRTPRSSKDKRLAQNDAPASAKQSPGKQQKEQRKLTKEEEARAAREESELNGAASKLQARQRGRVARRRVAVQKTEMHGAASMLQARQRGRIARKHVTQQRSEMNGAASMLQARQRGRVARRQVAQQKTEMNSAASKLQARARGRIARKEMAQRKAEAAVAAAQQAAAVAAAAVAEAKEDEEGYSDDDYEDDFSDDYEDETESSLQTETPGCPAVSAFSDDAAGPAAADWTAREHAAAAVVQARHRGRATRRQVATRRAEAQADRMEQDSAARRIQARHRGKLARQEASRRKQARRAAVLQHGNQNDAADEENYEEDAYEEDYDDDFSDFESQGAPTPVPVRGQEDDDSDELEAAARRIQARQRGKRARQEIREQHRAAAKMQAIHRGRAARQAARQQRAAEAVEAAREASLLAAALVEAAQTEGDEDDYDDEGFDDDFEEEDDASLDVDELWQQMEDVGEPASVPVSDKTTSAKTDPTSPQPAPFVSGEEFGELTAMPAVRAIAPSTGQEFLSPTPSMRDDIPSLGLGTPSAAAPASQPAPMHVATPARSNAAKEEVESALGAPATALAKSADDNYSDFDDDEFGSLDAEDIWDQPVMKADPLVPA